MSHPGNHVLRKNAAFSSNFYESDGILKHYLKKHTEPESFKYMMDKLNSIGTDAASVMDSLSMDADRHGPQLIKRTPYGEDLDHIHFHPSYWLLMDIAAVSEMFYVKYHPELRKKFTDDRHKLGFAAGQLFAMSELGVYCPLCMTDGAALIIDRYCHAADKKRLLPKLSSRKGEDLFTGAMYLTEKAGGSDVGANRTAAEPNEGDSYKLNGEKWFCSNANADVILVLARTGPLGEGTSGLSLFLVEKYLQNGKRNPMQMLRLKEKLGVRSMATAEVQFRDTVGKRVGKEGHGFKIMADMINLSRLYNAVAAVAGMRRGIVEAWQYLNHRVTFGVKTTEHPLIRQKFYELGANYVAGFLLVWRAIRAMDAAENGNEQEKALLRILTPMAKWWTAEKSVETVRDCMELMGGNGYIEDFVMPKLFRDVNVLPIWEGSGNMIVLDILRAIHKTDALEVLVEEIRSKSDKKSDAGLEKILTLISAFAGESNDTIETSAKPLFEQLIRIYQLTLAQQEMEDTNRKWLKPALDYMKNGQKNDLELVTPPSNQIVKNLICWDVV